MTLLLIQTAVILLVTLLCGRLARRLGQAQVIGEMVGGILLGPSLLGRASPHLFDLLFPAGSLAPFEVLSTVGLILFLFLIGAEVDLEKLYHHRTTAAFTSVVSILFPFALAVLLAPALRARFVSTDVGNLSFTLFLGISMSITAFPVLARILEERKMLGSSLGTTAIVCAAVDDVAAWLLLAVALAMLGTNGGIASLPWRMAGLLAYLVLMLGVARPLAAKILLRREGTRMTLPILGPILVCVFASAAATQAIGVHPLFGAFLAGICMPRVSQWQTSLRDRLDSVVSALLLPLFFALIGLRTRIDLLNSATIWLWAGVILIAAVVGKMGGAIFAARWTGQSWKDTFALAALLNTRGLVELVVLNIAYEAGIFTPTLFTMLVLMALITTAGTSPMLNLLRVGEGRQPT